MISKQKIFWKKPVFWQLVCNPKGQFLVFITRKILKEIGEKHFHLKKQGINYQRLLQRTTFAYILDA